MVISLTLVVVVVVAVGISVLAVPVHGRSMEPTLDDGDRIWVSSVDGHDVQRFTVVVGSFAENSEDVVKRVVGLPGDRVVVEKYGDSAGTVRVQPGGRGEWYTVQNPAWRGRWKKVASNCCMPDGKGSEAPQPQQVPPGMVFVLGDNIGFSDDSRDNGWMPLRFVRGIVDWRVYPISSIGQLTDDISMTPVR